MKIGMRVRYLLPVIASVLLVNLAACGGMPKKKELEIRIKASAEVNPDLDSRPSPIILHVLELTAIDEFNRADYFSLTRDDAAALGSDILNKSEYILTPGTSTVASLELDPAVIYLGFVAGYRDIDSSLWRLSQEIKPGKTDWISLTLERDRLSITEVND